MTEKETTPIGVATICGVTITITSIHKAMAIAMAMAMATETTPYGYIGYFQVRNIFDIKNLVKLECSSYLFFQQFFWMTVERNFFRLFLTTFLR